MKIDTSSRIIIIIAIVWLIGDGLLDQYDLTI